MKIELTDDEVAILSKIVIAYRKACESSTRAMGFCVFTSEMKFCEKIENLCAESMKIEETEELCEWKQKMFDAFLKCE